LDWRRFSLAIATLAISCLVLVLSIKLKKEVILGLIKFTPRVYF
jgi:hypothetical protein